MKREPDTRHIDRQAWNDVLALRRNILSRLDYKALFEDFRKSLRERDIVPLIDEFIDEELETLSLLAGQLRRAGAAMPDLEEGRDRDLTFQFRARRDPLDQLEFLRRGAEGAAEWYEERAGDESLSEGTRAMFAGLGQWQRRRIERLDELTDRLQGR